MRLGYPSVRHLMASGITSTELSELAALEWLEPDVGQRVDAGFASLTTLIWNITQKKKKNPDEFMPNWGPVDRAAVADKARGQYRIMQEVERMRQLKQKNK